MFIYQDISFLRSIPVTHVTRNYGNNIFPSFQLNQTLLKQISSMKVIWHLSIYITMKRKLIWRAWLQFYMTSVNIYGQIWTRPTATSVNIYGQVWTRLTVTCDWSIIHTRNGSLPEKGIESITGNWMTLRLIIYHISKHDYENGFTSMHTTKSSICYSQSGRQTHMKGNHCIWIFLNCIYF